MSIVLLPSQGDYSTAAEVRRAWERGEKFTVASQTGSNLVTKRLFDKKPPDDSVCFRYNKMSNITHLDIWEEFGDVEYPECELCGIQLLPSQVNIPCPKCNHDQNGL